MSFEQFGHHDCEARLHDKGTPFVCPICNVEWVWHEPTSVWEFPEARGIREEMEAMIAAESVVE